MPIEGQPTKGKGKASAVEAANLDVSDLGLDDWDFSQVGDPDGGTAVPKVDKAEKIELPWDDDTPDVPGEEDLGLSDLGVPGDEAVSVLAEYLPPIRQSLETLSGQVNDYHVAAKNRGESMLATIKAMTDAFGQRIDTLESSVHELISMQRALIQDTAPKGEPVTKPDKLAKKDPPAPKKLSVAEVGAQLKIAKPRDLPTILSALNGMGARALTVDQFRAWLTGSKVGLSTEVAIKVVELLQVKGPVTCKTFA